VNVQVGKLTMHAARHDVGFRVRAESRLRSLDLHPPGLPGHAILVVRRLELPAADHTSARRARTDLDRLHQVAARPAAGPVAAGAPVVLFRDEVELLACLTADLVHGVASHRWYWRQISPARAAGSGAALAAAWLRDVRWLPGSLARLPEPEIRHAMSLLSPSQAARVLRALLSAFGVAHQPVPPGPGLIRLPPGPPWRRWLRPTSLPPEAEALWGVALSLHHAPAAVRGPGYGRQLAAWRAVTAQATRFRFPAGGDQAWEDPAEGAPRPRPARRGGILAADPAGAGPPGPVQVGLTVPPYFRSDGRGTRAQGPLQAGPAPEAAAGRARARSLGVPGHSEPDAPTAGREASAGTQAWADDGVATGLASMLFLVNFVVWLDDRADPPWPGGWALVELLGRYLLGDRLADFAGDSLWDVLAELDGRRPGTVPAVRLGPADPIRLPRAWLERWPPPTPSYLARQHRERLVVRHPQAGFVAADVPCPTGTFDEVRAAEAARLGDVGLTADGPAGPEADDPGRRFDEAVGGFVRWLLRSRGIATSALTVPGRVLVTGTHVDVVLSLQDIDLAVRAAGLDRDPGWVPQVGRIVLFHFS